jgi:hypothetical protein
MKAGLEAFEGLLYVEHGYLVWLTVIKSRRFTSTNQLYIMILRSKLVFFL